MQYRGVMAPGSGPLAAAGEVVTDGHTHTRKESQTIIMDVQSLHMHTDSLPLFLAYCFAKAMWLIINACMTHNTVFLIINHTWKWLNYFILHGGVNVLLRTPA